MRVYAVGGKTEKDPPLNEDGQRYPIINPTLAHPISSAYQTFSFVVTCPGGAQEVEWSLNSEELGAARYYDQFSAQFVMEIAKGNHRFSVSTDCGDNDVLFSVGAALEKTGG